MKVYIEAFYADGSQILGNMNGQSVIVARDYKRTGTYKYAKEVGPRFSRVAKYRVVNTSGRVLEEWVNAHA